MTQTQHDEALARGLVVACLPEIEVRLIAGQPYRATLVAILEAQSAGWLDHHGEAVARRAAEILECLGPATALTPYGLARFLAEGPVSVIPTPDPRRGIPSAPPRVGI